MPWKMSNYRSKTEKDSPLSLRSNPLSLSSVSFRSFSTGKKGFVYIPTATRNYTICLLWAWLPFRLFSLLSCLILISLPNTRSFLFIGPGQKSSYSFTHSLWRFIWQTGKEDENCELCFTMQRSNLMYLNTGNPEELCRKWSDGSCCKPLLCSIFALRIGALGCLTATRKNDYRRKKAAVDIRNIAVNSRLL